jgi:hypothetical protein
MDIGGIDSFLVPIVEPMPVFIRLTRDTAATAAAHIAVSPPGGPSDAA